MIVPVRHPLLPLLPLVVAALCPAASAQEYAIKMTRPTKPGVTYHLDATGSLREQKKIITGGKTNQTVNEHRIELSGTVQVLATDSKGRPTKTATALEKCLKYSGQSHTTLLPAGKTLIAASTNGQTAFSLTDGTTLLPADGDLLRLILALRDGNADDDELFGTAERQHAGSSWLLHADAIARDMQRQNMGIKADAINGTTRFTGVTNSAGQECLEIRADMQITGVVPPLPAGMKMTSSEVTASFKGLFPVDTTRGRVWDAAHTTVKMTYGGQIGRLKQDVRIEGVQERSVEHTFTYPAD